MKMSTKLMTALIAGVGAIALILAATPAQACDGWKKQKYEQVDAKTLQQWMATGAVNLFDTADAKAFKKAHIPGAKHLLPAKVGPSTLPKDKAETIVFYCQGEGCYEAEDAAMRAASLGYVFVYVLPEGLEGFQKAAKKVTEAPAEGPDGKKIEG